MSEAIHKAGIWCLRFLWVLATVVAVAFVLTAFQLFRVGGPDTFARAIGEALIEIAFVALFGAALTHLLHTAARARAEEEGKRARQLDFLRRLRTIRDQVTHAQRLMRVHDSGKTYTEQHRALMEVIPPLKEITMDLKAAAGLFAEQESTIAKALGRIVAYLMGGGEEYERSHPTIVRKSRADHTRTIAGMHDAKCDLLWTMDFIDGGQRFKKGFDGPFAEATEAMTRHAYRPRVRMGSSPAAG